MLTGNRMSANGVVANRWLLAIGLAIGLMAMASGCAADENNSSGDPRARSTGVTEPALSTDTSEPSDAPLALDCSSPTPTCRDFCTCQYRECLESGGIPSLCRAESVDCFRCICGIGPDC